MLGTSHRDNRVWATASSSIPSLSRGDIEARPSGGLTTIGMGDLKENCS